MRTRASDRGAGGRIDVELLLEDMEDHEQRFSPDEAFDFGKIRHKLRLE